jgi:hypothetical protein
MHHKRLISLLSGARALQLIDGEQFSGHAQDPATLIYTLCN